MTYALVALLIQATDSTSSTWDNPHEAAKWLFTTAGSAYGLAALGALFNVVSTVKEIAIAFVPGTIFICAGVTIYLFG